MYTISIQVSILFWKLHNVGIFIRYKSKYDYFKSFVE